MKKNIFNSICLFSAVSFLGTASLFADDNSMSSSNSAMTPSNSMTTVNCENYNEGDENSEIVPGQGFTKGDLKKDGKFKYDVNNVLTVQGTVVKVLRVNRNGKCHVFLIVKTDNGRAIVKLRSVGFLEKNGVTFNEGDQLQIKGSQNKVNGRIFIVAKEITKDGNTLKLRDEQGNAIGGDEGSEGNSSYSSSTYSSTNTQSKTQPSSSEYGDSSSY